MKARLVVGALNPQSSCYIERAADASMRDLLMGMEYVQITEPRQQGKTSLLFHVARSLPRDWSLIYIDAEGLGSRSEASWYQQLSRRVNDQLGPGLAVETQSVRDAASWREYLLALLRGTGAERRFVIALDEVGRIDVRWAEGFFCVLREVYNLRAFRPDLARLTFVLAGAFDPSDLIRDTGISPFNVAQHLPLRDFGPSEVSRLAQQMRLGPLDDACLAELLDWTGGQPYLTHNLCGALSGGSGPITKERIQGAARELVEGDASHLKGLKRQLASDPSLAAYARSALSGGVQLRPSVDERHFRLVHVVGLLTAGSDGRCRLKGRIYRENLPELGVEPPIEPRAVGSDVFVSYADEDRERVLPIVQLLEGQGWSVWWDRAILPGKQFDEVIESALDGARCVVVAWSRTSVASRWVKREAGEGARRDALVPILLDSVDIPLEFSRIQAARLHGPIGVVTNAETSKLLQAIALVLAQRTRDDP